jgi:hypothetical protein
MYFDKINVMCPTYGRAKTKLPEFVQSALKTAEDIKNLYFTFMVHQGDNETVAYLKSAVHPDRLCILTENEPTCNLSLFFNRMYDETPFEDAAVSLFGDDMIFITKKWDRIMLDKINDSCGLGIVYGDDDNIQHGDNCVHFVTSRRLINMTGKPFMCELFKVEWIDTVWYELGKALNLLEYLPYLHIKHNHSMNPEVGFDKTFVDMRKLAGEADKNSDKIPRYVDEMAENIKTYFKTMSNHRNLAVMMTTYDRVYLLKKTVQSLSESVVLPETIHVFDDGSVRAGHVRKAIPENGYVFHEGNHVSCEKNHRRAFEEIFKKLSIYWVVVIDSDSLLYKFWYVKVVDMVNDIMDNTAIIGLFNKGDRDVLEEAPKGYQSKEGIGGIGMVVSRRAFLLLPKGDALRTGWDNQICKAVREAGYSIIAPERAYIQHTGYIEGIHANDRFDEQVSKKFCGAVPEEEDQKQVVEGQYHNKAPGKPRQDA